MAINSRQIAKAKVDEENKRPRTGGGKLGGRRPTNGGNLNDTVRRALGTKPGTVPKDWKEYPPTAHTTGPKEYGSNDEWPGHPRYRDQGWWDPIKPNRRAK
jgi:hypothetical protein